MIRNYFKSVRGRGLGGLLKQTGFSMGLSSRKPDTSPKDPLTLTVRARAGGQLGPGALVGGSSKLGQLGGRTLSF